MILLYVFFIKQIYFVNIYIYISHKLLFLFLKKVYTHEYPSSISQESSMASLHFVQSWLPSSNSSWRSANHWMERGALFPETQVSPLKLRISPEKKFIWRTKNCRFSICLPKNPCFCHEIEDWTKHSIGIMSRCNKWYVMWYVTYVQTNPRLYIGFSLPNIGGYTMDVMIVV